MIHSRSSDDDNVSRGTLSFMEPRPPHPYGRTMPQKGKNLLSLLETSESDEPDLLQVYLRLKPCNAKMNLYEVHSERYLITSLDTTTAGHGRRTQHNVSKMYTFSQIFEPNVTQKEIFEQVVKDNLKKLPEGKSFTLLTYGASGSGKTFTLMGTVSAPGLVPRSLEYVFKVIDAAQQATFKPNENGVQQLSYAKQEYELQWVKRLRQISAPLRDKYRRMSVKLSTDPTGSIIDLSERRRHYVWVSFIEIYNEGVYDLLALGDRKNATKLAIREDSSGNVYVKGATQAFVRSGEEAYDVMVAGKHNLQVAATGVHSQSSRSHCIFTITMLTETDGAMRTACVRLCDLAGCERAARTRNTGARMHESRAINSSLHVLERCLRTLRRKRTAPAVVPYRESKLTRLLGAGLSGTRGEAVSMVVTVNPAPEYANETKHVLQLAAVAKDIQINNTMLDYLSTLESSTQDSTIDSSAENMQLRADNERLHFELIQARAHIDELAALMEEKQAQTADTMRELVEEAKDMTAEYYEKQLSALRRKYDEMVEEYESRFLQEPERGSPGEVSSEVDQAQIVQLMTKVAVLEEQISAERLARARAEEEVQHLRACIEERDEKADEDDQNYDIISLSDDDDSDDENVPSNESLEPTIRKEDMNRSRIIRQSLLADLITYDVTSESDESVLEKSTDTLKDNESHVSDKTENISYDNSNNDVIDESEPSTKLINISSKASDFKTNSRDTYFVSHANNVLENDSTATQRLLSRETYCITEVNDSKMEKQDRVQNLLGNDISIDNEDVVLNEENNDFNDISQAHTFSKNLICLVNQSLESNNSLRQFERLELETNTFDSHTPRVSGLFSKINLSKEQRKYFDDAYIKNNISPLTPATVVKNKDKTTDFDNIENPTQLNNDKTVIVNSDEENDNMDVTESKTEEAELELTEKTDVYRSPSIVKEAATDFEPNVIKKLLGNGDNDQVEICNAVTKLKICSKSHISIDMFEDADSPIHSNKCKEVEAAKPIRKTIDLDRLGEISHQNDKQREGFSKADNTLDEFENIYKNVTEPRATEFDLLVTQEIKDSSVNESQTNNNNSDDLKYNLRKKNKSEKQNESNNTVEGKINLKKVGKSERKSKPRRNLRLCRQKHISEENDSNNKAETKLHDIVNLQTEFSDVTLDLPAPVKATTDLQSPEKVEDKENSPVLGVQSCPARRMLRSQRKLFTPRAEPLEESSGHTGDSNERVYVPRPSYHRPKARRKL